MLHESAPFAASSCDAGGERRVEDVVRVVRVVRAVAVAVVVVVIVIRRLREIYDDVDRRAAAAAAAAAVLRVDARGRGAPPQPLRRGGEAAYRAARGRGHRAFPACDATAKTEHSNEERGARLVQYVYTYCTARVASSAW